MSICPTCGAQNDPGNRFCDQCGTRIDAPATAAPDASAATPDQPTMAAPICPSCGAVVLPGEAFCDNCGADLVAMPASASAAPVSADAPTMLAATPPTTPAPPATSSPAAGDVRCPSCGQVNLPGEAFCDNCGASLSAPVAAPVSAPVAAPDDATILATPPVATQVETPPPAEPVAQPDDATILAATPTTPPEPEPAATPEPEPAPAPEPEPAPAATPEPEPAPAGPDPAAHAARKAELEAEADRQQQIIAQFEQMQATFGAATPAAVVAGLDEARNALAKAQADLAALALPTPAVDPEALRLLEAEIGRQQQIIAQFEQMQATFGAATPAAVVTGLDEARNALAKAQADLAALSGGVAPTAHVTPTAPVTPAAPTPAPPAPTPRLVVIDGGKTLSLPTDKAEIIVGREDPVSSIFPEVDLTSFGGEAGGVSRQHAKITHSGDTWTISDLNSTNFTRVDGVRLEPYVETPIHDGARIQFGRVVTTFMM